MGVTKMMFYGGCLALLLSCALLVEAQTPPGIAKNPARASCKKKEYKMCYNLEHVCPKFCPDSCHVECASCKPICSSSSSSSDESEDGSASSSSSSSSSSSAASSASSSAAAAAAAAASAASSAASSASSSSSSSSGSGSGSGSEDSHNSSSSSTPPKDPYNPPKPSTPSPSPTPKASTPKPSTPSPTPKPSTPKPSTPSASPSSPTPSKPSTPKSTGVAGQTRARCRNKNYGQCYNQEHVCPASCPTSCQVDCNTCKPVCNCDYPGAVCQDPRFIGGDGITFYFHGKKDKDFCLVTDPNLHINAHFIGKRNANMGRDFTWVESTGIMFDNHKLFLGARKTSKWDDANDRLALDFDGELISLDETTGSQWTSTSTPQVTITRTSETNSIVVEVQGKLKIKAKVVPITEEDSRIHNYGVTSDDCLAHLDLGFKFYSLSGSVDGVLGRTYRDDYVSRVNVGAAMPVMGGEREYATSSIFATDCLASRFNAGQEETSLESTMDLATMNCASGMNGRGVVCKR